MVEEVSKEQRKGVVRKRILQIITPLFIILLCITGYFLYQDVRVVNNFFTPTAQEMIVLESDQQEWTSISVNEEPFLNMKNLFWKKEVVNNANSESPLEIRIINNETNEEVYYFKLDPGKEKELDKLERNTDYSIEAKGENGSYFITFL